MDLQYFEGLLQISYRMYQKVFKDFTAEREYKNIYDESMLSKINGIMLNIGGFLEEEISLNRAISTFEGNFQKTVPARCSEFITKNSVFLYDFASLVIESVIQRMIEWSCDI